MALSILVLTEDSGKDARAIVEKVAYSLLKQVDGTFGRMPPVFETVGERLKKSFRTNNLAPAKPSGGTAVRRRESERRKLLNHLATRLAGGTSILLHYDGDGPWESAESRSLHADAVASLLEDLRLRLEEADRERLEPIEEHFLHMIPFYSLEAWLYLNEKAVAELARSQPLAGQGMEWLRGRFQEGSGYDHIPRIKQECPLGARFNRELAETWSAKRACGHSPSCRATLDTWKAAPLLRDQRW